MRPHRFSLVVALTFLLLLAPIAGGVAVDGATLTDEPRAVSEYDDATAAAQQSISADGSLTVSADNLTVSVSNESGSVGTFSVATTRNGTTVPLLAPLDAAPSSYLTVQVDGTNYTSATLSGSSTSMSQFVTEQPTAVGDDAIVTEWTLPGGVVVTQTITLDDGTAAFDVSVNNTGTDSHEVNVRFAFDYEVGDRTNPVVVDGEAITSERTFVEPTFDSWYVADKPARPNVAATASVDEQPSAVTFVSRVDAETGQPTLDTAPYDYPTDPERVVYRTKYGFSSVDPPGTGFPEQYYEVNSEWGDATGLVYYELGSLESGGSETATTNYSLGKQVTTTTPRIVVSDQELRYSVLTDRITVDSVFLPDGGFIAVYAEDGELLDTTAPLPNETLPTVQFSRKGSRSQEVTVVAYRDSDGDSTPDPAENATDLTTGDDAPYLVDGEPVLDRANVTIDANTRVELSAYPFGPFIEGSIVSISAEGRSTPEDEPVPVTQIAGPTATRISDEAPGVIGGGGGQFVAPAVEEPTTLVFRATYTDRFGNTVTATTDVVVEPAPATPTASVQFDSVESDGRNATLGDISSTEGGFVAIYDESPATAGPEDVIGVTNYVRPGTYDGLLRPGTPDGFSFRTTVPLFDVPGRTFDREKLTETQTLYAVFHRDTDEDRTFDFVTSDGATDQPYVGADDPVSDDTEFVFVPDPQTYWQVDLIGGEPYQRLGPHADNGFYGDETASEDRLLAFAHGNDVDGLTVRDAAWPNKTLRECVETGIELTADDGTASVTFTVAEGCEDVQLSFAAYEKPGSGFSRSMNQTLVDAETDSYDPGTYTVTVELPDSEEEETA